MNGESDPRRPKGQGADWTRQQERSNLAILRLMVWISLTFGRAIGRLVLHGIAAYYVVFAPRARRASRGSWRCMSARRRAGTATGSIRGMRAMA